MSCRRRAQRPVARRRGSAGFSLLEVILALAILSGSVAVLGEVTRGAMENARIARDVTVAQLLCESKMAEVAAAITPAEMVTGVPFDETDDPALLDWLYTIEVESIDEEGGLLVVRVTVVQDLPAERRPVEFSLTRWLIESSEETSEEMIFE